MLYILYLYFRMSVDYEMFHELLYMLVTPILIS